MSESQKERTSRQSSQSILPSLVNNKGNIKENTENYMTTKQIKEHQKKTYEHLGKHKEKQRKTKVQHRKLRKLKNTEESSDHQRQV